MNHCAHCSKYIAVLIAATLALCTATTRAGTLYWDTNGATAGSGATPTGTWDLSTTSNWTGTLAGTAATTVYTTNSDVVFAAAADAVNPYTVTLSGALTANTLLFKSPGTPTLTGGTSLTLSGGNITVNSGVSGIINSVVAGNVGLTKLGGGTLTLNGSAVNTFTGGLTINNGTIVADYANLAGGSPFANLINSGNTVTLGGGSLIIKGRTTGGNTTNQSLGNVVVNSGGGQILGNVNGGTATNITLGTLTCLANGGSMLLGVDTQTATTGLTITTTTNKDAQGIYGGRLVYYNGTANTGYDWATTASAGPTYTLSNYSTYTTMVVGATSDALNDRVAGAGITLTGAHTHNSLKLQGSSGTLALQGFLLTLTNGGLLVTGTTATTISGTAGATRLTAGNGSGSYELIVHQYNSGGLNISAVIGNNGANATSLTKAGSQTLTLSGANTYTGGTTVNAGTLTASGITFFGNANNQLTVNGGTVELNGNNIGIGNLTGNGGTIKNNGANMTLTIGNNNGSGGNYAGTIANGTGTVALTKAGTGTITLSGASTFTGAISIVGTLKFGIDNALPGSQTITLGNITGGLLDTNGFNYNSSSGTAFYFGNNNGNTLPSVCLGSS